MLDENIFLLNPELSSEKLEDALHQVRTLTEENKFLVGEVAWLKEQLAELKRTRFGTKSERWESEEQALLFNEAEMESQSPSDDDDDDGTDESNGKVDPRATTQVAGHTRVRGKRRRLPENLPREIIKIELPQAEQCLKDGTPLVVIGWETSEKLKYEPARVSVTQYQRAKYGVDHGDYVKTAPPVPAIIPKGIAGPELLSAIATAKYADGLPLYRQEEILNRHDIDLSRSTMGRWMIKCAEALRPIWNVLSDKLTSSFYMAIDETHLQVLKENGRKAETKSWMWVRSTPYGIEKIILFDYSANRTTEKAKELIADFKGYLQCDGLSTYDKPSESEDVTRVGCNMHARRRFESAQVTGAKSGKSFGEQGLLYYKKIYDLEEEIKDKSPDEKKILRNKIARPIFEEMHAWVIKHKIKVPKKSKIGDAFAYFESKYENLLRYLDDGRLLPDNGFTERAIRKFAIGRNNWMFSDTVAGAEASSILYSIVVTAKVNGVNPYQALVKLFTELPLAKTIEDYERLAQVILAP